MHPLFTSKLKFVCFKFIKFSNSTRLKVCTHRKFRVQILSWNLKGLTNWDCLKVPNLVPPKDTSTPQLEQAAVAAVEHDSKLIIKSHKMEDVQVRIRYINIIISSFTLLRNFERCNLIIQNFETKFEWCRKIKTTFKKFCKTFEECTRNDKIACCDPSSAAISCPHRHTSGAKLLRL
jgi:hypothetical protein